ncbi:hypothetical protein [Legionella longbeachae]|uniref:hypothetical protein n=1 Tax=Legionella longbeachae TaxID=450 RepID=UPI000A1C12D0|nr:hypothetical protein [Legionella longbeachae]ARM32178.1 hypothetical protein B0B39_00915 [Legionella longbeachae]QEY51440.1 hypothetical protein FQU71_09405 [Legionella longbeachae]
MNREKVIKQIIEQFEKNIKHASDDTLKDIQDGKLTISLSPALEKESGGLKYSGSGRTYIGSSM